MTSSLDSFRAGLLLAAGLALASIGAAMLVPHDPVQSIASTITRTQTAEAK